MIKFFTDAISEIYNVTWPSKKHYMHISVVAIVFTLSSAVFIWIIDYSLNKWVKTAATNIQIQTPISAPATSDTAKKSNTIPDVKAVDVNWKPVNVKVNKTEEK